VPEAKSFITITGKFGKNQNFILLSVNPIGEIF